MKKIALSLIALAALSTASFADRNRDDSWSFNSGVTVDAAPLAVYGSTGMIAFEGHQGGR
ncbi:MAG: hypothetical protein ACREDU_10100 [Methylocella sp.]